MSQFDLPKDFTLRLGWCAQCRTKPARRAHNGRVLCLDCWKRGKK